MEIRAHEERAYRIETASGTVYTAPDGCFLTVTAGSRHNSAYPSREKVREDGDAITFRPVGLPLIVAVRERLDGAVWARQTLTNALNEEYAVYYR